MISLKQKTICELTYANFVGPCAHLWVLGRWQSESYPF